MHGAILTFGCLVECISCFILVPVLIFISGVWNIGLRICREIDDSVSDGVSPPECDNDALRSWRVG